MSAERYQQYRLRNDHEYRGVLDAAAIVIARNIINESPETPNHAQRVALANLMMGEETPERRRAIEQWAIAGMLNPTILATAFPDGGTEPAVSGITSNDADFVIASEWDKVANLIYPELAESEG
jgi:hypothetical protein